VVLAFRSWCFFQSGAGSSDLAGSLRAGLVAAFGCCFPVSGLQITWKNETSNSFPEYFW
jgi:hypothetical protein